jgi:hypothetical protein
MTPKKAIIILLILSLIIAAILVILYMFKSPVNRPAKPPIGDNPTSAGSTGEVKLTPEQQKIKDIGDKVKGEVGQIVEQGKTPAGGITNQAAVKLEDAINRAIMEEKNLKPETAEQLEADRLKQAEKKKLEREINQQIKNQP